MKLLVSLKYSGILDVHFQSEPFVVVCAHFDRGNFMKFVSRDHVGFLPVENVYFNEQFIK